MLKRVVLSALLLAAAACGPAPTEARDDALTTAATLTTARSTTPSPTTTPTSTTIAAVDGRRAQTHLRAALDAAEIAYAEQRTFLGTTVAAAKIDPALSLAPLEGAGPGVVGVLEGAGSLLLVTADSSGHWYCLYEAVSAATRYGTGASLREVATPEACAQSPLAEVWAEFDEQQAPSVERLEELVMEFVAVLAGGSWEPLVPLITPADRQACGDRLAETLPFPASEARLTGDIAIEVEGEIAFADFVTVLDGSPRSFQLAFRQIAGEWYIAFDCENL